MPSRRVALCAPYRPRVFPETIATYVDSTGSTYKDKDTEYVTKADLTRFKLTQIGFRRSQPVSSPSHRLDECVLFNLKFDTVYLKLSMIRARRG
jgi:hypothetical protein